LNGLISTFQSDLRRLMEISGDLEKLVSLDQLQQRFSEIDLTGNGPSPAVHELEDGDQVQDETQKLMEASYNLSFAQIKTVVQNKINYFGALKL
jgi:hypothetical protein